EQDRIANREDLTQALQKIFSARSVDHWVSVLNEAGVPAGPVYSVPEMFTDPQVSHLEAAKEVEAWQGGIRTLITQPVTLTRTPASITRTAPGWGEHNTEILTDLGYSDADIDTLRSTGAI